MDQNKFTHDTGEAMEAELVDLYSDELDCTITNVSLSENETGIKSDLATQSCNGGPGCKEGRSDLDGLEIDLTCHQTQSSVNRNEPDETESCQQDTNDEAKLGQSVECHNCTKDTENSQNDDINHAQTVCKNGSFECFHCSAVFRTFYDLCGHLFEHPGSSPFYCDTCGTGFIHRNQLLDHRVRINSLLSELPYECDICAKGFTTKYLLQFHKQGHYKVNLIQCGICKISFASHGEKFLKHFKSHTVQLKNIKLKNDILGIPDEICNKIDLFSCNKCSQTFNTPTDTFLHIKSHSANIAHLCINCGVGFDNFSKKKKDRHNLEHKRSFSSLNHQCETCNQYFKKPELLNLHRELHAGKLLFKCQACHRSYGAGIDLYYHLNDPQLKCNHLDEEKWKYKIFYQTENMTGKNDEDYGHPKSCFHFVRGNNGNIVQPILRRNTFTCDVCGDVIETISKFLAHLREHGLRNFDICGTCGKGVKSRYKLSKHKLTHNSKDLFLYQCSICDMMFKCIDLLILHNKVKHQGKKPFHCDECQKDYGFSRRSVCWGHVSNFTQDQKKKKGRKNQKQVFKCKICSSEFQSLKLLDLHVQQVHLKGRKSKNQCSLCLSELESLQWLDLHAREFHLKTCLVCSEIFETVLELKAHKKDHVKENPFKCGFCGEVYNDVELLLHHVNIHIQTVNENFYVCDICTMSFRNKLEFDAHKQNHKYKVFNLCGCRVTMETNLSMHRKVCKINREFKNQEEGEGEMSTKKKYKRRKQSDKTTEHIHVEGLLEEENRKFMLRKQNNMEKKDLILEQRAKDESSKKIEKMQSDLRKNEHNYHTTNGYIEREIRKNKTEEQHTSCSGFIPTIIKQKGETENISDSSRTLIVNRTGTNLNKESATNFDGESEDIDDDITLVSTYNETTGHFVTENERDENNHLKIQQPVSKIQRSDSNLSAVIDFESLNKLGRFGQNLLKHQNADLPKNPFQMRNVLASEQDDGSLKIDENMTLFPFGDSAYVVSKPVFDIATQTVVKYDPIKKNGEMQFVFIAPQNIGTATSIQQALPTPSIQQASTTPGVNLASKPGIQQALSSSSIQQASITAGIRQATTPRIQEPMSAPSISQALMNALQKRSNKDEQISALSHSPGLSSIGTKLSKFKKLKTKETETPSAIFIGNQAERNFTSKEIPCSKKLKVGTNEYGNLSSTDTETHSYLDVVQKKKCVNKKDTLSSKLVLDTKIKCQKDKNGGKQCKMNTKIIGGKGIRKTTKHLDRAKNKQNVEIRIKMNRNRKKIDVPLQKSSRKRKSKRSVRKVKTNNNHDNDKNSSRQINIKNNEQPVTMVTSVESIDVGSTEGGKSTGLKELSENGENLASTRTDNSENTLCMGNKETENSKEGIFEVDQKSTAEELFFSPKLNTKRSKRLQANYHKRKNYALLLRRNSTEPQSAKSTTTTVNLQMFSEMRSENLGTKQYTNKTTTNVNNHMNPDRIKAILNANAEETKNNSGMFKCSYCDVSFANHCHLLVHVSSHHHGEMFYICLSCGYGYSGGFGKEVVSRQLHDKTHNVCLEAFKYSCDKSKCGQTFLSQELKDLHWKVNHKKIPLLRCDICLSVFKKSGLFTKHYKRCLKRKYIDYTASSKNKANNPSNTNLTERKTVVNRISRNRRPTAKITSESGYSMEKTIKSGILRSLNSRQEDVPKIEEIYVDASLKPNLLQLFSTLDLRKLGIESNKSTLSENDGIFFCEYCGDRFKRYADICVHLDDHAGKSFICLTCGIGSSTTVGSFESWKRKHEKHEKLQLNYSCDSCYEKFSRSELLDLHKQTHKGQSLLTCENCWKDFPIKGCYINHIKENKCLKNKQDKSHPGIKEMSMTDQKGEGSDETSNHENLDKSVVSKFSHTTDRTMNKFELYDHDDKKGSHPSVATNSSDKITSTSNANIDRYAVAGMSGEQRSGTNFEIPDGSEDSERFSPEVNFCGSEISEVSAKDSSGADMCISVAEDNLGNRQEYTDEVVQNSKIETKHNQIRTKGSEAKYRKERLKLLKTKLDQARKRVLTNEEGVNCKVCNKFLKFKKSYMCQHGRPYSYPNAKICSLCGKVFGRSLTDLKQWHKHMKRKHSTEKLFKCDTCGSAFSLKPDLTKHMLIVHSYKHTDDEDVITGDHTYAKTESHDTDFHDQRFTDDIQYKEVNSSKIEDYILQKDGKFICELCGKILQLKKLLKHHILRSHIGEKNKVCPICNKAFVLQTDLRQHSKRVHSEITHDCKLCSKKLRTKFGLDRHMKNSHKEFYKEEKKIGCHICKQLFTTLKELRHHKNTDHTNLKFYCHICGHALASRRGVRKHIERVHQKENANMNNFQNLRSKIVTDRRQTQNSKQRGIDYKRHRETEYNRQRETDNAVSSIQKLMDESPSKMHRSFEEKSSSSPSFNYLDTITQLSQRLQSPTFHSNKNVSPKRKLSSILKHSRNITSPKKITSNLNRTSKDCTSSRVLEPHQKDEAGTSESLNSERMESLSSSTPFKRIGSSCNKILGKVTDDIENIITNPEISYNGCHGNTLAADSDNNINKNHTGTKLSSEVTHKQDAEIKEDEITTDEFFICDQCGHLHSSAKELAKHKNRIHTSNKKCFNCNLCGVVFNTVSKANLHRRKFHPKIKYNSWCFSHVTNIESSEKSNNSGESIISMLNVGILSSPDRKRNLLNENYEDSNVIELKPQQGYNMKCGSSKATLSDEDMDDEYNMVDSDEMANDYKTHNSGLHTYKSLGDSDLAIYHTFSGQKGDNVAENNKNYDDFNDPQEGYADDFEGQIMYVASRIDDSPANKGEQTKLAEKCIESKENELYTAKTSFGIGLAADKKFVSEKDSKFIDGGENVIRDCNNGGENVKTECKNGGENVITDCNNGGKNVITDCNKKERIPVDNNEGHITYVMSRTNNSSVQKGDKSSPTIKSAASPGKDNILSYKEANNVSAKFNDLIESDKDNIDSEISENSKTDKNDDAKHGSGKIKNDLSKTAGNTLQGKTSYKVIAENDGDFVKTTVPIDNDSEEIVHKVIEVPSDLSKPFYSQISVPKFTQQTHKTVVNIPDGFNMVDLDIVNLDTDDEDVYLFFTL